MRLIINDVTILRLGVLSGHFRQIAQGGGRGLTKCHLTFFVLLYLMTHFELLLESKITFWGLKILTSL